VLAPPKAYVKPRIYNAQMSTLSNGLHTAGSSGSGSRDIAKEAAAEARRLKAAENMRNMERISLQVCYMVSAEWHNVVMHAWFMLASRPGSCPGMPDTLAGIQAASPIFRQRAEVSSLTSWCCRWGLLLG